VSEPASPVSQRALPCQPPHKPLPRLSPGRRRCSARAGLRYLGGPPRRAVRRPAGRPAAAGAGADVSWRLPQRLSAAVMSEGGQQSPSHETAGVQASELGHWSWMPTSSTVKPRCKAAHSCLSLSPPGTLARKLQRTLCTHSSARSDGHHRVITASVSLTDFILEGSTAAGACALGDWSTEDRSARAATSASLDSNVSASSKFVWRRRAQHETVRDEARRNTAD